MPAANPNAILPAKPRTFGPQPPTFGPELPPPLAAAKPNPYGPEPGPPNTKPNPYGPNSSLGEPQLQVCVGGKPLDPEDAACIQDLSIELPSEGAAQLTLRLLPQGLSTSQPRRVDLKSFAAGAEIRVSLGYGSFLDEVFVGDIVGVGLELGAGTGAVLTVTAYEVLHRLGRAPLAPLTVGEQSTIGDIVRKIAESYHLSAVIEDSDADKKNKVVNRGNQSDLDFLLGLAGETGHELIVVGGTLLFRKAMPLDDSPLFLDLSRDVITFSAHIDAASQVGGVDVVGFDNESREPIRVALDNPDSSNDMFQSLVRALLPRRLTSYDQAKAQAESELARIRSNLRKASVVCFGRTDVRPGGSVQFADSQVGERFGGTYHIQTIQHTLSSAGGFRTQLTLGAKRSSPSPQGSAGGDQRSGASTTTNGLTPAIVTKKYDPERGRIKVRFPWMGTEEESDWIWVLSPSAGKERGFFFMPEEGDYVLVAMPDSPLDSGYVLGALWNTKDTPPSTTRDRRTIKSVSGHVITLDDTKDAELISIVDRSGKNKIVLDAKHGTLSIESGGDLEINAKGKLRLHADQDLELSGANLKLHADGKFAAEGHNMALTAKRVNVNGDALEVS